MKLLKNLLPVFVFLFSLQGCAQHNPDEAINVNQFKERIKNNDSTMVILDVRTESELTGPLPKIKDAIHIPVQEIEERFNELKEFKDKELVIVCRTQNRSSRAAEFLKRKGYNTKYVTGGMQEFYKK
jgi:rhodanese-related sulfurtransferase